MRHSPDTGHDDVRINTVIADEIHQVILGDLIASFPTNLQDVAVGVLTDARRDHHRRLNTENDADVPMAALCEEPVEFWRERECRIRHIIEDQQ